MQSCMTSHGASFNMRVKVQFFFHLVVFVFCLYFQSGYPIYEAHQGIFLNIESRNESQWMHFIESTTSFLCFFFCISISPFPKQSPIIDFLCLSSPVTSLPEPFNKLYCILNILGEMNIGNGDWMFPSRLWWNESWVLARAHSIHNNNIRPSSSVLRTIKYIRKHRPISNSLRFDTPAIENVRFWATTECVHRIVSLGRKSKPSNWTFIEWPAQNFAPSETSTQRNNGNYSVNGLISVVAAAKSPEKFRASKFALAGAK